MELEEVRNYASKYVRIILKHDFIYTTVLPDEIEQTFSIKDMYGDSITVDCSLILMIAEVRK